MMATVNALDQELQQAFVGWAQEMAGHGILITDSTLHVRGWNSWFETNTGIASESVKGRPLTEVFPDLTRRHLDRHFHSALGGEVSILSSALHNYLFEIRSPLPELG